MGGDETGRNDTVLVRGRIETRWGQDKTEQDSKMRDKALLRLLVDSCPSYYLISTTAFYIDSCCDLAADVQTRLEYSVVLLAGIVAASSAYGWLECFPLMC